MANLRLWLYLIIAGTLLGVSGQLLLLFLEQSGFDSEGLPPFYGDIQSALNRLHEYGRENITTPEGQKTFQVGTLIPRDRGYGRLLQILSERSNLKTPSLIRAIKLVKLPVPTVNSHPLAPNELIGVVMGNELTPMGYAEDIKGWVVDAKRSFYTQLRILFTVLPAAMILTGTVSRARKESISVS